MTGVIEIRTYKLKAGSGRLTAAGSPTVSKLADTVQRDDAILREDLMRLTSILEVALT